jgi:hypothetical protein
MNVHSFGVSPILAKTGPKPVHVITFDLKQPVYYTNGMKVAVTRFQLPALGRYIRSNRDALFDPPRPTTEHYFVHIIKKLTPSEIAEAEKLRLGVTVPGGENGSLIESGVEQVVSTRTVDTVSSKQLYPHLVTMDTKDAFVVYKVPEASKKSHIPVMIYAILGVNGIFYYVNSIIEKLNKILSDEYCKVCEI